MTFERARAGEEEAILRLYRSCVASPFCTWDNEYPAMENIRADMAQSALYVVRGDAGEIVAAASLGALNDIDPQGFPPLARPCELARLCVSPIVQGQGVGGQFLRFLLCEAERQNFDGVRLTVSVGQKIAQRLYQRVGFAECGKRFCYGNWFYLYHLKLATERGRQMERMVGTTVRGIRAPIIRQGDDIAWIVANSVLEAAEAEGFALRDRDVVAVTEAVVARAQGNYATTDQIGADVRAKFGEQTIGVIFPILSRNRFAMCLKGIAKGAKKIVLMLSYPSDEVGNHMVTLDALDEAGIDPYTTVLTEAEFRALFGTCKHTFTGVDYMSYYRELIESAGCEAEIVLANDCRAILRYTPYVLACDIHTRARTKRLLRAAGASLVYGLDDILSASVEGSGYNEHYGLLGSNKATEESVKLFPRNCKPVVEAIQALLLEKTGRHIEVMIYGDGAFKDPVGKIWELADPVVSPAYTPGLEGRPNEVKIKYLADNDFAGLTGAALRDAINDAIRHKESDLVGNMAAQGTTPRRLTDLLGSLCDLTSGSGDKGTPIVLVQGYFDNYAS
ncbi:MAG TPA: GNAT family N-acetyltransferase [Candidatus Alectryocaccomicrobium excrementavium]|uniref:GNAT family N-acetyltransferase n=1 Tax=Candidatus Alectryocaccomicrobium excrementavium TaxID=2840668 RepID=A0A9D1FXJ1_9FIRM|nr:GNAT family N-acetyltransferase [Candidatus Alectryocaccomicrobium excrementavium]